MLNSTSMSGEKDIRYLRRAIEMAREGMEKGVGGPFGAVIVLDGKVIAEAYNEVIAGHDPTAHAEVQAIRKACKKAEAFHLPGATIYTSCEPCPMCLGAIYWAHIHRVVYASAMEDADKIEFYDLYIAEQLKLPRQDRSIQFDQLLKEEGADLFRMWSDKEDKTNY